MKGKIVLIGLVLGMSISMSVKASGNLHNVEAMYIYNFLRHINWPESNAGNDFVIGVYGNSPVFNQLQEYAKNRRVGTKPIVVRRINSDNEALNCQLVFVPTSSSGKISGLKSQLGNRSCLIVSEKEGSISSGSTVEFMLKDDKLGFRINEERAKQQNLEVSRALLNMAN
ncbi:MAG: YfiR family protein [Bacteroidales bacterium]|nr:YfiR family protein [Bacteroidales bacterium]